MALGITAQFPNPNPPQGPLRLGRVLGALLAAGLVGYGGWTWMAAGGTTPGKDAVETAWMPTSTAAHGYQPDTPPIQEPTRPPRDLGAEREARMLEAVQQLRGDIDALKQRPAPQAVRPPPARPPLKHAPMLFVSREQDMAAPRRGDTFTLAPGATKIPCIVETAMHSDVESIFTVKTTQPIYDTKTGQHLLIPQQSTVLGRYSSSQLLYGNQRLPTQSTTLTFPDGRSVPLDNAPVLDQQGNAGLVTTVNTHWWRNFGAVIIQGVLRGGAQAFQTGAAAAGAPGQVGAGVVGSTSQYGQQVVTRSIDTRPTITVEPGALCTILLVTPLHLPAFRT